MKKEWGKYYKGVGTKTSRQYKSFEQFCDYLISINAELCSDYIDSNSIIEYNRYNFVFYSLYVHLKRQVESIDLLLDKLKLNNDKFIKFIYNENNVLQVKFYDSENNNENIIAISAYGNFIRGRKRFYDELNKNGHIAMSPYINNDKKVLIDFKCGHEPSLMSPNSYITQHQSCPICSCRKIVPYVNDFYTIHSDCLKYLKNPEETIGEATNSRISHECICPECGLGEASYTLDYLARNGFNCKFCNNKSSYFNRFGNFMFKELNEKFESEKTFDWCKFKSFDDITKDSIGIYDFVMENKKIIVEFDGGFHKNNSFKSYEESKYVDDNKDDLAIENGYHIIRVDCDYNLKNDRFKIFKENILNSELPLYFNISSIDLDKINEKAVEPISKIVADYWNKGYTLPEISEIIGYCNGTTRSYLRIANKAGWCNSDISNVKMRSRGTHLKVLQENKLVGLFESIPEASRKLVEKYHIPFDKDMIRYNVNGKTDDYKGLHFIKIDMNEYRELLAHDIKEINLNNLTYLDGTMWFG